MNILILMDMPLFPYRIYAYNELSNRGYDLTVISVSDEDTRYDLPLKFEHIRLEKKAIGGFVKLEHFSQIEPNKYDVIVVDPPRKGCDELCLETIVKMAPEKVVYVSCDSSTLARDVKYLGENGYAVKRVRTVDMFGMSGHVETVALLTKKDITSC